MTPHPPALNTSEAAAAAVPAPTPAVTIRVLGVGDAGCNVAAHLARDPLPHVSFAGLNTNARALAQTVLPTQLSLGARMMRGLGTGGDPERGRAAAEVDMAGIRGLCEGADIVFLVVGLGGGTGTGAGPVVARAAREQGALVLVAAILPFACEGQRRQRQAQIGLHDLKKAADVVICVPNQNVFKLIDDGTSLLHAFALTNELVAQGLRGIWRLLSKPGLLNADFADLCALTQGKHAESALATAEASGENRVQAALDQIRSHPLLESGQALSNAAGVLVSLSGGPGLAMSEVHRLMEEINQQAENAHVVLAASLDDTLGDRLQVTLIASRPGAGEPPAAAAPSEESLIAPEIQSQLVEPLSSPRPASRFLPPPPELTAEQTEQLWTQQEGCGGRRLKSRFRQGQLPLEIVSKGRFEKSEPTIHRGEDLDVPTYVRRGVALN
ncbi:MAG: cell division FtsZ family protein [Verrucomicrobia bacterium]|nr:cell division FtsZ family protein [Verrucomicrobiota bacterium]